MLSITQLSKSFGGLEALHNVSLEAAPGMVFGIIGPNGAGKTTLFNVVTGLIPPSRGTIRLDGADITKLKAHQRNRVGMARTFQNIRLFSSMSVLGNVLVGQTRLTENGVKSLLPRYGAQWEKELQEEAEELLAMFGLYRVRHRSAKELPYADQRRVEMARALAARPRLLLLDEPTAGMNEEESANLAEEIAKVKRADRTILLIEHDMSVVMGLCARVAVLNFGQLIAEGTPEEITADAQVIEAYLGKEDLTWHRY